MNYSALVPVALGVVLVVVAWRGSMANVWNMLTGHPPGPHTAGALVPGAGPGPSAIDNGGLQITSGAKYTFAQLRQLAMDVGLDAAKANIAAAIGLAESGGDPHAVGDSGTSFGLWQIHLPAHPNITQQCAQDPVCAAHAMFDISSGGTNWHPWSTFTNGSYVSFLPSGGNL